MQQPARAPKNAVVILLDSLNRHLLGAWGSDEFDTPVLDAFARDASRLRRHYVGSLPCMPARHDILCGALDFLWKPWGSIELWEAPVTRQLAANGITSMLVSDHPHLFETGGENFHTDFSAWAYERGHEGDPWRTRPDPSWVGSPALPAAPGPMHRPYDDSRTWFRDEADFPGPKTMRAAADWVRTSAAQHDRFLLFVDEFDPHEPFDTPEPWASRYDPDWEGDKLIWPPYVVGALAKGVLDERAARQLRANYGAKLSMIDHWLGTLLGAIDDSGVADDTLVVICTDHGHYLGEHDTFGKPATPLWEPLAHTPLMIRWPGQPGRDIEALTTNVDIHATLLDLFGVTPPQRTHGHSLLPLLDGRVDSVREWALAGVYGRWVSVFDGQRKYARAPVHDGNLPLSMWSNRWSTMPVHGMPELQLPLPDSRAVLDRMPGSSVPVLRQPFAAGDPQPYWCWRQKIGEHHCHDVSIDPDEVENRLGGQDERDLTDLLHTALKAVDAPGEQFERLGLS